MQFCFSLLINCALNLFLKDIAAPVAGYADSATAFRSLLNLPAAWTSEIPVVLSVTVQKSPERIIYVFTVPGQLCHHLGIVTGKYPVDGENDHNITDVCRNMSRYEYVRYNYYHAVSHQVAAQLVHTVSAGHELCYFIS